MYYFKRTETDIEKYEVTFNEEEIKTLREEIINNCSEIIHHEYDSTMRPIHRNYRKVKNYKYKKIGIREYEDGPDEDLYHFSFDEYIFPQLINVIDRLLNDNTSALNEIYNPKIKQKISFAERIESISKELNEIDNLDFKKKRKKLDELEEEVKKAKLNENQKPIDEYYPKLQALLTTRLVDTLPIEIDDKVSDFYNISRSITKEKDLSL